MWSWEQLLPYIFTSPNKRFFISQPASRQQQTRYHLVIYTYTQSSVLNESEEASVLPLLAGSHDPLRAL